MRDRNIGSPHIGHGRLAIGGFEASEICDCCMVRPSLIQAGARLSLSHRRLMPQSMMFASVRQAMVGV
jgi:hypothetical protein